MTPDPLPITRPVPATASDSPADQVPARPSCEQCGAPLDEHQRYCVSCGTRRRDAADPAAAFLAEATRRRRRPARTAARPRRPSVVGAVVLLALLPVAVGVGVLVGRGSGTSEDEVLAALRAQARAGGTLRGAAAAGVGAAPASATAAGEVAGNWTLKAGYTVALRTLPRGTTSAADAARARREAAARGARGVGLIDPRRFEVTPRVGRDVYVVYAGAYRRRGDAARALRRLRRGFAGARVVAVRTARASASAAGGGRVLARTSLGTAHQVEGFKPSRRKIAQDRQIVRRINHSTGKSYVQQQRGLPDTIVVPDDPGAGPTTSAGGGGQP